MPPQGRRRVPAARRPVIILLACACLVAVLSAPVPAAAAATACADAVVGDWSKDGRIDGTYPLGCYPAALKGLPPDVRDYSTAGDEIRRALAVAVNDPARPRGSGAGSAAGGGVASTRATLLLALLVLGGVSIPLLALGATGALARILRKRA